MRERIKGRKNFPTDEVDPGNFFSDDDIRDLIKDIHARASFEGYKVVDCFYKKDTKNSRLCIEVRARCVKELDFGGWDRVI